MAKILTSVNKVGNFLIREQWRDRNFCREDALVALTSTISGRKMEVGEVVIQKTGTTKFVEFTGTAISEGDVLGIIVDERIGDEIIYQAGQSTEAKAQLKADWATGEVTLAVLVRGDAIVRRDGLNYGNVANTTGNAAKVKIATDQLIAQGIRVEDQLKGKFATRPVIA